MISIIYGWPATVTRRLRGHHRVALDVGGALGGAENAVIRAAISEHAVSLFSIVVEAVGVPVRPGSWAFEGTSAAVPGVGFWEQPRADNKRVAMPAQ